MKPAQQVGLLAAGPVSRGFVAQLPNLREELGPVAGRSYRVASRLVNSFRAGYAVKDPGEVTEARTVLVAVPEQQVDWALECLCQRTDGWAGRTVLLCGSRRTSRDMARLADCGAATGTLNEVPGLDLEAFVTEGDPAARVEARRLLSTDSVRLIEVDTPGKDLFFAGITCVVGILPAALEAALRCFRSAGAPPQEGRQVAQQLVEKVIRQFSDARKRAWTGPLADESVQFLSQEIDSLRKVDALLAEFYDLNAALAGRLLADKNWNERNPPGTHSSP